MNTFATLDFILSKAVCREYYYFSSFI